MFSTLDKDNFKWKAELKNFPKENLLKYNRKMHVEIKFMDPLENIYIQYICKCQNFLQIPLVKIYEHAKTIIFLAVFKSSTEKR